MLQDPGSVELPEDPERWFGRSGRLAVEIGFGSGEFLDWLARTHADWNIVGADISPACHQRAYRLLRREGHTNVRLFKGRGEFLVREVLPEASVHRAYVNFPDPWPKARHRERRLLDSEFLQTFAGRLASSGLIRLTTDHRSYFEWALKEARAVDGFSVRVSEPPPAFRETKYARKWRECDRDLHHAVFERRGRSEWVPRAIERTEPMHHAKLHGFLPEDIEAFDRPTRRFEDGIVAVVGTYSDVEGAAVVCLAHVEEPDLTQRILIEASEGEKVEVGREITVRIRRFNEPLMTRGTSLAIEYVAEWVADLDDRNAIVERRF